MNIFISRKCTARRPRWPLHPLAKYPRKRKPEGPLLTYHSEDWCWVKVAEWKQLWVSYFPSYWLSFLVTGNVSEIPWKRRHQATFVKWQPGWAHAPLHCGCLQLILAPCLMWMTKQEEGNVGKCNMGWLGSEASIHICWEKFHHQRSSDDNVESSSEATRLVPLHTPQGKIVLFLLCIGLSPILCDLDCMSHKRTTLALIHQPQIIHAEDSASSV
jgi:hypothetical protein